MHRLSPASRVWIYQVNRFLNDEESAVALERMQAFVAGWTAHNRQLLAAASIYHNRFLVFMVDESQAGASGCSIDKLVHFMQDLDQALQTDSFDRLSFAWMTEEEVRTASKDDFARLYQEGLIGPETRVFDNLVATKEDFDSRWLKPLAESWHARFV